MRTQEDEEPPGDAHGKRAGVRERCSVSNWPSPLKDNKTEKCQPDKGDTGVQQMDRITANLASKAEFTPK